MSSALNVFLNGSASVFVGMAVLYLTIRCLAALAGCCRPKGEQA